MLKKIVIIAAALVALLATPAAAQYGEVFSATISNSNPAPGETTTISGTCEAADEVEVAIEGEGSLGTIPVVDDQFSGPVTIPSDLEPGVYTLTVTCGGEVLSTTITVGGSGGGTTTVTTTTATPLPRTGADDTSLLLKLGGGLVLAGAAFALVATKRRSATA
ncbi:MAG TPA: LPXTG cell wall anchor domain-containing protein [Acidimicrobiales bacterium]|nr:LPXTG cell wall anchor domain-containing protein [Acidimicrobiales bacterium]